MDNNIFPLPFPAHVIFVAVAVLFFAIQFIRLKYKYELIMAAAVVCTMLIYVKDSRMWFYSAGILEFGLILTALVVSIVEKRGRKALAANADAIDDNTEESEVGLENGEEE